MRVVRQRCTAVLSSGLSYSFFLRETSLMCWTKYLSRPLSLLTLRQLSSGGGGKGRQTTDEILTAIDKTLFPNRKMLYYLYSVTNTSTQSLMIKSKDTTLTPFDNNNNNNDRAAASTRVNYSSNLLLLETRVLVNFHFRLQVFAVNWWIVGIYGNLALCDCICNLPACQHRV